MRNIMGGKVKRYQAVICDMFDTLVNFRWDRVPLVPFDGREVRSTSPLVYEAVRTLCPQISLVDFCHAFIESSREAEATRTDTQREITAHDRFRMLLRRLRIGGGPTADAILQAGIPEQMRQLRLAMEFPEENRAALDALKSEYRLAVLSNFDHGPAVAGALADFGIHDRFELIVVSADVGWRKPHPEIFRDTLRRMGIDAHQAIFVGDTPEADVLGPRGVGMDAIWIDRGTVPLPAGAAPPTHIVSRFAEITRLL
jgi:HAD superfamily hydrolase (TIGR01549 family)